MATIMTTGNAASCALSKIGEATSENKFNIVLNFNY